MSVWQWGPLNFSIFSITFYAAVLLGLLMVLIQGKRKLLPEQRLLDFIIIAIVGGIFGSRLSYVLLFNFSYYLEHPALFFRLQDGGMCFLGGVFFSLLILMIWGGRKGLILERYLDLAAPALALSLALGHIGTAVAGRVMGKNYPWGIPVGEQYYHPDGLYMIVLLMALFLILRRRREGAAYEGELFVWFIAGYGMINLVVEFFRDHAPVALMLTAGQLASLAAIVLSLFYILAWPKIYTTSSYLGYANFGKKKKKHLLWGQLFLYLLLTAPLVFLYYLINLPINIR